MRKRLLTLAVGALAIPLLGGAAYAAAQGVSDRPSPQIVIPSTRTVDSSTESTEDHPKTTVDDHGTDPTTASTLDDHGKDPTEHRSGDDPTTTQNPTTPTTVDDHGTDPTEHETGDDHSGHPTTTTGPTTPTTTDDHGKDDPSQSGQPGDDHGKDPSKSNTDG